MSFGFFFIPCSTSSTAIPHDNAQRSKEAILCHLARADAIAVGDMGGGSSKSGRIQQHRRDDDRIREDEPGAVVLHARKIRETADDGLCCRRIYLVTDNGRIRSR